MRNGNHEWWCSTTEHLSAVKSSQCLIKPHSLLIDSYVFLLLDLNDKRSSVPTFSHARPQYGTECRDMDFECIG